jgi:D-glycero-alpha-D-manno-heptose-7-phosphate kinase
MIVTKTPYRISFFGGGTDYPGWFRDNGGSVISASIDKYCYITCRYLPKFFEHKHRFVYSEIESVTEIDEIRHPAIKGVLGWMQWNQGIELHHDGDLPARSGLGSSSSFTVGMINTLNAMLGKRCSKKELAASAIFVEQRVIGETVGSQDQIAVAYGGLNRIDFHSESEFIVSPLILSNTRKIDFHKHLMLFYTGQTRFASQMAKAQMDNLEINRPALRRMQDSVNEALEIFSNNSKDIQQIGFLLDDMWRFKKTLSDQVTNSLIDGLYLKAMKSGALGGKMLGAGGGGFMLFFVPPSKRSSVKAALIDYLEVPFNFDYDGSAVTVYNPTEIF